MNKEERSPRVTVTLPEGSIDKLDRYAGAMKTKQASAAAYLLQVKLDDMEREGEIPQKQLAKLTEQDFEQIKDFTSLLLGDHIERNRVSFALLGRLLEVEPERLSELYQLITEGRSKNPTKGKTQK